MPVKTRVSQTPIPVTASLIAEFSAQISAHGSRKVGSAALVHQADLPVCDGVVGETEIDGRVLAGEERSPASQEDGDDADGEHVDRIGSEEGMHQYSAPERKQ
jgi:hypothetical protein